jgi:hypothetical protein
MRRFLAVVTFFACATLSGCGPAHSRVHGTVHYQGQPLARGTIVFLATDNRAYPVKIKKGGFYEIAQLPRGLVKVSILAPEERRPPLRGAPGTNKDEDDDLAQTKAQKDDGAKKARLLQAPLVGVELPPHYSDAESSGLSFNLELPDQEFSVKLE